jgi:hypothetical protein
LYYDKVGTPAKRMEYANFPHESRRPRPILRRLRRKVAVATTDGRTNRDSRAF